MDPDTEIQSILRQQGEEEEDDEERKKRMMRPPSSYGSMKSDSESDGMKEKDDEEEGEEELMAEACPSPLPVVQTEGTAAEGTGLQLVRPESPQSHFTMSTQQTKPPGALVLDTRSSDLGDFSDDNDEDEDDLDELLTTHSPEPPEPIEPEDMMQDDENSQPGKTHPEQDLPFIFKSVQSTLSKLDKEELFKFKMRFYQWGSKITLQQVMDGDILDLVDRMMESLGMDTALWQTINALEAINKKEMAEELKDRCNRELIRSNLKQFLLRYHEAIREGVPQAGKHNLLNTIYVEPQISTCGYGGVDPSHEFRDQLPVSLQVPTADTFVGVNNLFKLLSKEDKPVRTVLTTGIPGIGMTVSVSKFCVDWAELRANKDLQFVLKLSFQTFWHLRNKENLSPTMSFMDVLNYIYPSSIQIIKYMEEEDCTFLIIMDSFDCYKAPLDWENAPVIDDINTKVSVDDLIVNIVRGTVLRGARLWILGRRAAVSQIPSQLIDVVTEIQGFSDEMIDDYMIKRFDDAELARKILAQSKRLPTLRILARQPFTCWMLATVFERCFSYLGYGQHPPRMTPFYISIMVVQNNRRLEFYYGKLENDQRWSNDDKSMVINMGKMALRMLERNTSVFFEEDMKECGLDVTEVTVFSGVCTELPTADSKGRRTYCFMHFTFQEFMAAFYVFTMFHTESKNVLEQPKSKVFPIKEQSKSAVGLVRCALSLTLNSPLGHYDLFLRFLCGLLSPDCHEYQLSGSFYPRSLPKVSGLDEVQSLLEDAIKAAESNHRERLENLKECLREMTQEDE